MKPIILTGFMGCGKSTIGQLLAQKTNRHFEDADTVIEQRSGMSIPRIFELEGEDGFRKREAQVFAELLEDSSLVLATGGGAVLKKENRDLFLKKGIVVFLKAEPSAIYERVSGDDHRPLAKGKTLEELTALYESRMPYYKECHICYETMNKTPLQCVNELQQLCGGIL
ncbi:MAG: shikimate kinase [Ruminococcaceae bacterium]|nr:shikimate kinase [Oscillospiraceae bacterium]